MKTHFENGKCDCSKSVGKQGSNQRRIAFSECTISDLTKKISAEQLENFGRISHTVGVWRRAPATSIRVPMGCFRPAPSDNTCRKMHSYRASGGMPRAGQRQKQSDTCSNTNIIVGGRNSRKSSWEHCGCIKTGKSVGEFQGVVMNAKTTCYVQSISADNHIRRNSGVNAKVNDNANAAENLILVIENLKHSNYNKSNRCERLHSLRPKWVCDQ